MTDRFLNTYGSGKINVTNGTVQIYGSTIGADNLTPSRAIKTDSQGVLQSTDIDISDINNLQSELDTIILNSITNPLSSDLDANLNNIVNVNQLSTDSIASADLTRFIDFNTFGVIDITAPLRITINTPVILQNARTQQLVDVHTPTNTYAGVTSAVGATYCTSYGSLAGSSVSDIYNTAYGYLAYKQGASGSYNTAIGSLSLTNATTGNRNTADGFQALYHITTGNNNVGLGFSGGYGYTTGNHNISIGHQSNDSIASNGGCISCIAIGAQTRTNNNTSNSIVIGDSVISTISNEAIIGNSSCTILRNGGTVCDLGTTTNRFKDLYLSGTINGLTTTGGVWMQLTEALAIASAIETDLLLGSSSVGSLTVPANKFSLSAYELNVFGNFSSQNGSTITFRFKFGGVVFSLVTDLTGTSTEHYELECQFTISALGGVGVASITLNSEFSYSDTSVNSFLGNRQVDTNNTQFDTTISNTLEVTAQFSGGSNTIQCLRGTLTKIY